MERFNGVKRKERTYEGMVKENERKKRERVKHGEISEKINKDDREMYSDTKNEGYKLEAKSQRLINAQSSIEKRVRRRIKSTAGMKCPEWG